MSGEVTHQTLRWWGELRAALNAPGRASWQRICALLEVCPSRADRAAAISSYCVDGFRQWPNTIKRDALPRWIDALHDGDLDTGINLINTLGIDGAMLGDAGLERIFESSLPSVRYLSLRNNLITGEGLTFICHAEFAPNLFSLDLENNCIGNDGAIAIAESESCSLRSLNLRGNRIDERGARALAASENLEDLGTLELDIEAIGLDGARAIATSATLPVSICVAWEGRLERAMARG